MTDDDLFLPVTSDIIVACKARDRYFDLDAVRGEHARDYSNEKPTIANREFDRTGAGRQTTVREQVADPAGAPPLDWWNLPWQQMERRLVASMCPERVCTMCGKPSRRIVKKSDDYATFRDQQLAQITAGVLTTRDSDIYTRGGFINKGNALNAEYITLGWTDCQHNTWRQGVVLDPFAHDPKDDMTTRYLIGDTRAVLATLEADSVDLVLSSPPFLALRSYLPADHPDKTHEIGSEATPGEFIDVLLDVVEACARVLAPHGSLVFELGDTYAGSGGGGGDYLPGGMREGQQQFAGSAASMRESNAAHWRQKNQKPQYARYANATKDGGRDVSDNRTRNAGGTAWPLDKSLTLVPQLFAYALAYGHNPLTGRTTDRWRIRNIVRWVRPNPPVGALGDKYRPATSELIVACKARDRYFDLDAVREPGNAFNRDNETKGTLKAATECPEDGSGWISEKPLTHHPAGAPPLDWWQIPTAPYKGSHYATWPPALCIKPILSMCPERVCTTCGKPSRRITEPSDEYQKAINAMMSSVKEETSGSYKTNPNKLIRGQGGVISADVQRIPYDRRTTGWSDCQHNTWRPGHVLDPFAGSATTLAVAHGHSRDATGIDLDPRNAELAYGRLGMFLEVEDMRENRTVPSAPQTLTNPKYRVGYVRPNRNPAPRPYGAVPDGDVA